MAAKNCAHSGCDCKVQEEKAISRGSQVYCSEHCANTSASVGAGNCGCGHPDCGKLSWEAAR
jgi:Prokaryotic metallothionein